MSRRPSGKSRRSTSRRQRARHQLGRIREHLAKGNIVLEVRDARAPGMTDPTRLVQIPPDRVRAVVLTKADLADPDATARWRDHFQAEGYLVRAVDQSNPRQAGAALRSLLVEAKKRLPGKLRMGRAVVVGLPNVGKSTLINRVLGRRKLLAGDRPGVTKGETWARIEDDLHLLDTPGVIEAMNRLVEEAGEDAYRLGLLRLAPEALLDQVHAAARLLVDLGPRLTPPGGDLEGEDVEARLRALARRWNRLRAGGEPDLQATAGRLLREVGEGTWGRYTLDLPAPPAGPEEGEPA